MDSNELAAFAATTEKTERKKRSTSTKTTHYRDFSFLISFLSILFDFVIFTPPNQNFFFYFYMFWNLQYILFWKLAACSFLIYGWLKIPVLLYFEEKSHMINQKSRALSEWLIIMLKNRLQYLRLHMKICWRFHIKTTFTFWEVRT